MTQRNSLHIIHIGTVGTSGNKTIFPEMETFSQHMLPKVNRVVSYQSNGLVYILNVLLGDAVCINFIRRSDIESH